MISFDKLPLIAPIKKALQTQGYTTPTPIQAQAIPLILERNDILGCAQTGTGKTAAFAIPIIQLLVQDSPAHGIKRIRALVLTPTRELAIQIAESFSNYGANTSLKCCVIFGGVNQYSQVEALRHGVDVLIATPGRLLNLMQQKFVHLQHLQFFVLDEADRMLDMGFVNDVKKVIAVLPKKRQSLFFSATMPQAILKLADTILQNPAKVAVTPENTTAETVSQTLYYVDKENKKNLLQYIIKNKNIERTLVFTRTKHGADRVAKDLSKSNIAAQAIHGNKSQNARQHALQNFKNHLTRVLVATDIAARGIDIDDLTHVINYDLPNIPESYVHRIGRTGRAGADGIAISFCDVDERPFLDDINKLIGFKIPVVEHPYPMQKLVPEKKSQSNPTHKKSVGSAQRNPHKRHQNTNKAKPQNNRIY